MRERLLQEFVTVFLEDFQASTLIMTFEITYTVVRVWQALIVVMLQGLCGSLRR